MLLFKKLSIYYTWKNIRQHYNKNKLKIMWNDEFKLPNGSYSISDQDYIKYIIKNTKYYPLSSFSYLHQQN